MFNYLLGYVFEDFPGAGLVALVDQQVVGQIVGRSPEAGAAAQGTDETGYSLHLEALFRHPGRGLVVEDPEAYLLSAWFRRHATIIEVGLARC